LLVSFPPRSVLFVVSSLCGCRQSQPKPWVSFLMTRPKINLVLCPARDRCPLFRFPKFLKKRRMFSFFPFKAHAPKGSLPSLFPLKATSVEDRGIYTGRQVQRPCRYPNSLLEAHQGVLLSPSKISPGYVVCSTQYGLLSKPHVCVLLLFASYSPALPFPPQEPRPQFGTARVNTSLPSHPPTQVIFEDDRSFFFFSFIATFLSSFPSKRNFCFLLTFYLHPLVKLYPLEGNVSFQPFLIRPKDLFYL